MSQPVVLHGSAVKRVTCEKCGRNYSYELKREKVVRPARGAGAIIAGAVAVGGGMAGAKWLGGGALGGAFGGAVGGTIGGAIAAAMNAGGPGEMTKAQSQKNLERRLAKSCDPVPCPRCGWYQAPMVREARRRYQTWLTGPGATLLALGACGLLVLFVFDQDSYRDVPWSAFLWAGAVAALGLALLVLRWLLQRAYDINHGYPAARPPFPDSPAARGADEPSEQSAAPQAEVEEITVRDGPEPGEVDVIASRNWYYMHGGRQNGPVSWSTLQRLVDVGLIELQDKVRGQGYGDWTEAAALPGLVSATAAEQQEEAGSDSL